MTKLKGILLTEGKHGMISQVEGLAKALDLDFIHERIELNNIWKFIPPKLTPVQNFVFKNNIKKNFNIIISCGRKSVIPSILLKQKFRNKVMNIHIQDPKVSLTNFDFIVVPEHDSLNGKNILTSKGAIHYLRNSELNESADYLKQRVNKDKIVTLIIGGPNKYYDYNESVLEQIFIKVKNVFINNGFQLIFIPSMRTPKNIIEKAKNFFDENQIIIVDIDKKAYLSSLKLANQILGGSSTARLFMNLREDKGYTYGSYSRASSSRYKSSFIAKASVRTEVTKESVEEIIKEIKRIKTEPVQEKELTGVKEKYIGQFIMSTEKPSTMANFELNKIKYN